MVRFSIKDRIRFIDISNGSLMEVMCQLEIAQRLGYISEDDFKKQEINIATIAKMILGLRKNLEEKLNNNQRLSDEENKGMDISLTPNL